MPVYTYQGPTAHQNQARDFKQDAQPSADQKSSKDPRPRPGATLMVGTPLQILLDQIRRMPGPKEPRRATPFAVGAHNSNSPIEIRGLSTD